MIQKYQIDTYVTTLFMPWPCIDLCVHEQDGVPCLWVDVDLSLPARTRVFQLVGTGMDAPSGVYHGTCFCDGYVWHIYETGTPDDS